MNHQLRSDAVAATARFQRTVAALAGTEAPAPIDAAVYVSQLEEATPEEQARQLAALRVAVDFLGAILAGGVER